MATTKESLVLELVGIDKTQKAHDSAKAGIRSHAKEAERLIKKLKEENATLGMGKKALLEYKMAQMGATSAQKEQIRALQASIDAKKRATGVSQGLNQQLRFMRGGFGQVGHQIQDIAVQLQMGTNAFVVFGQQGSQIASLFGPGGAIIGAVLAVGAAIAVGLSADVKKGTEALDSLQDHIEGLIENGKELEQVYKDALAAIFRTRIANFEEDLEGLNEELANAQRELNIANGELVEIGSAYATAADATELLALAQQSQSRATQQQVDNVSIAQGEVAALTDKINRLKEQLQRLAEGKDPFEDLDKNAADLRDFVKEIQEEAETLGFSARQLALREAALLGANKAQIAAINTAYDAIEAYEAEEEALKDLIREEQRRRDAALDESFDREAKVFDQLEALEDSFKTEIEMIAQHEAEKNAIVKAAQDIGLLNDEQAAALRVKIAEEAQQAMLASAMLSAQSVINSTKSQVDTLRGFFDEASGIGKAFFLVSQAMAAADAVIKGFQQASAIRVAYANMAAMAGPGAPAILAAGEAHAAMAIGMGIATAGAIAGQTIASFEGGGITFNGARSGGLDGKGGRMAMVHPNEKITDMEKGGDAQQVNISFNIQANDARGFDELLVKRRAMIVNMVNKAVNNRGRRSLT